MEKTRKEKIRDAGIRKYGSEQAWREAMREFGAKADRTTPRGFTKMSKEKRSEISRRGAEARWAKEKARQSNEENVA